MKVYAKIERDKSPVSGKVTYVVWYKRASELNRWPCFDSRWDTRAQADASIERSGMIKVKRWFDAVWEEEQAKKTAKRNAEIAQDVVNGMVASTVAYHLTHGTWD